MSRTPFPIPALPDAGRRLLDEYLINDSVGIACHVPAASIERMTGQNVTDLRRSAVSSDRFERSALDLAALERVARSLGRTDATAFATSVASITPQAYQQAARLADDATLVSGPLATVRRSYAAAFEAELATRYVAEHHPGEHARQIAESRLVRNSQDPGLAESVVASVPALEEDASLEDRAIARARHAVATEVADEVARGAMMERIRTAAAASPHLGIETVIEQARMSMRAAGVSRVVDPKASQRAAWMPLSMSEVQSVAAEARRQAAGLTVAAPVAVPQAQGVMRRN
jgi:hypothetical protein